MRARNLLAWIAVGLVGLALAAGVTYAATQLSSQRIGLSAEPPSAGEELAPPAPRTRAAPHTTPTAPTTTRTAPNGSSTSGEPADDYRGSRTTGRSEEHGEGSRGNGSGSGDLDD